MPVYKDQIQRSINLQVPPKRIVSLVPSQTELLFDLGLDAEVIGITKFCIHPVHWFRTKTRIGGTKTLSIDSIRNLNPDLIIANKEENTQEQIEALIKEFPVWISDINKLADAIDMINQIGHITDTFEKAKNISTQVERSFEQLKNTSNSFKIRTCYLIWKDPYMSVGEDTLIHDMLNYAGFENVLHTHKRYPEITIGELKALNCELILLSSEPYPFKEKHINEIKAELPETKVKLVDGEAFSWYGSRLIHTPSYLQQLQQEIVAIS